MKIKRSITLAIILSAFHSLQPVQMLDQNGALIKRDGIYIEHRGLSEVFTNLAKATDNLNSAIDDARNSVSFFTTAQFGIVAVGATCCIGGARWCYEGWGTLMSAYFPLEKKQELKKRYKALKKPHPEEPAQPKRKKEKSKEEIDEYLYVSQTYKQQHLHHGALKIVSGALLMGIGGYLMFRPKSVMGFFSGK